jgi:predicted amidophosphoribosyltransferase
LILPFKHADRTELAAVLAPHMARAGAVLLREADLLVPVPLHRWRLFRRRYNQAALLANAVGRIAGRPSLPDVLARPRATASLGEKSAAERAAEVAAGHHRAGLANELKAAPWPGS